MLTHQSCISNSISPSMNAQSSFSSSFSAREYVESLHQNSKSQLVYGKNNVIVQQKDSEFAGYLSLHLNSSGLLLKWTPNQLMNSAGETSSQEDPQTSANQQNLTKTQSSYWEYAMCVDINTIVYLHCQQQSDDGATIVLVAPDGVQHPPIKFPKGSHLLQFLTCLENGLAPNGRLDPPLWNEIGKGKIFPKLQRRSTTRDYRKSTNLKKKLSLVDNKLNQLTLNAPCQKENFEISEQEDLTSTNSAEEATTKDTLELNKNHTDASSYEGDVLNNSSSYGVGDDEDPKDACQVEDFVFRIINSNSDGM